MKNTYDVRADGPINVTAEEMAQYENKRFVTRKSSSHKLMTIASVTLRLYEPSTLLETQALRVQVSEFLSSNEMLENIHDVCYI